MANGISEAVGKEVLPYLAELYQQLYLPPTEEGNPAYKPVVLAGEEAEKKDLSHFVMDDRDSCVLMDTPAGQVRAVTLHQRKDFETALNCIGSRCRITPVPATQGASILDGVISWKKIRDHEKEYRRTADDWDAEFSRFTADKKNYTEALILLSYGPYSAVKAERLGIDEETWLKQSDAIRRFHECTHFVARRLYHDQINAVFDELAADAVGLYAALGRYDRSMAETFLGIQEGHYVKGRLENYVKDPAPETLDLLAGQADTVMKRIGDLMDQNPDIGVFDLMILLEEHQQELLEGICFPE